MNVVSTSSFNKDISKIKNRRIALGIEKSIRKMETAKLVSDIPGVKKLSGSPNAFRIRVGDYRLGFL